MARDSAHPHSFRVYFGADEARFNDRIPLEIMVTDGDPKVHRDDEGTRFSAAPFFSNGSIEHIRQKIIECWAIIYTGLPKKIFTDTGSAFGPNFIHLARVADDEVSHTVVEAHPSLCLGNAITIRCGRHSARSR